MSYIPGRYCGGREVEKCRDRLIQYCRGCGLDLGCGGNEPDAHYHRENKITPLAIGVDLAQTNLTGDAANLFWFKDNILDYIFSSHLLEHLERPEAAIKEWFRVLKPGGYLVLYLPLTGHYPDPGQPGANQEHKWALNPTIILDWLRGSKVSHKIVRIEEQVESDEYSFDFVSRKEKNV